MTTTTPMNGVGTCTGTVDIPSMPSIMGSTYLAVGSTVLINGGSVFGLAECECRSRDISMVVHLTSPIPYGTTGVSYATWIGSSQDCSQQMYQSLTGSLCEQISANSPPGYQALSSDQLDGDFKSIAPFNIPIPAEVLTNPQPVGTTDWNWACNSAGVTNPTVYALIGPNPTPATCELPVFVNTTPAQAPTSLQLSSGDGALTATWSVPTGTTGVDYYQILCRKMAVPNQPSVPVMATNNITNTSYWFSACINGTLYRRPTPGSTSTANTQEPAGATAWYPDMGVNVAPPPDMAGEPPPDMIGEPPPDMTAAVQDGGTGTGTTPSGVPFPIDPNFICSDKINAAGSALLQRISGLQNGTAYEVMVVSIDDYGNAAASNVVAATPQMTENPLQPFCDTNNGNCPTGFGCQFATAPVGAASAAFLLLLSGGFIVYRQRRRQRQRRAA
jgi:hypothetical protein